MQDEARIIAVGSVGEAALPAWTGLLRSKDGPHLLLGASAQILKQLLHPKRIVICFERGRGRIHSTKAGPGSVA